MILAFFEISYLIRFVWDDYLNENLYDGSNFYYELSYDLVGYADGMSFVALLLFHRSNF